MNTMRLDKFIANSTAYGRKEIRKLIRTGAISVDGTAADSPDLQIPESAEVRIRGELIRYRKYIYLMLNKPQGYLSAVEDKHDPVVVSLVPEEYRHFHVFPVGRLDYNTTGLLIMTNDGDLANALMHPSKEFDKKYLVRAQGIVTRAEAKRLEQGIDIGGFVTSPAEVSLLKHDRNSTIAEIIIHEGKNRQVRRMFEAIGHPVLELCRTGLGDLTIGKLAIGQCRKLSPAEVENLKKKI